MKLTGSRFRTSKRQYFFTQRAIKMWNSLPEDVLMATGIDSFRRGLDSFMEDKSISGY